MRHYHGRERVGDCQTVHCMYAALLWTVHGQCATIACTWTIDHWYNWLNLCVCMHNNDSLIVSYIVHSQTCFLKLIYGVYVHCKFKKRACLADRPTYVHVSVGVYQPVSSTQLRDPTKIHTYVHPAYPHRKCHWSFRYNFYKYRHVFMIFVH